MIRTPPVGSGRARMVGTRSTRDPGGHVLLILESEAEMVRWQRPDRGLTGMPDAQDIANALQLKRIGTRIEIRFPSTITLHNS